MDALRVMIVEDEALLLMQMENLIEDEGHEVVGTAMSSEEALRVADLVRPDVMFVDVHLLDGPTGIDIARRFRNRTDVMVVFLTANSQRLPGDYAGAAGVIAKPLSQAGIGTAIQYICECVRRPPPVSPLPFEFTLSPVFRDHLTSLGRTFA
jgi:DNA-binding response OmpR family regulator